MKKLTRRTSPLAKKSEESAGTPKSPIYRFGKKAKQEIGGDHIEVRIQVGASVRYQSCSAAYQFRTTDPQFMPNHGDSMEKVTEAINTVAKIVIAAVSKDLPDIYGTAVELADKVRLED